jgi:hypothetical protein
MLRALAVAVSVALLAVAAATASTLSSIAVTPAQVAPGYEVDLRADTNCVKTCVTLDMCGFGFPSEAKRLARYQVNYTKPGSPTISNEVVSYVPGGAAQALTEVKRAVVRCPSTAVSSSVAGVGKITYRIKVLKTATCSPVTRRSRSTSRGPSRDNR